MTDEDFPGGIGRHIAEAAEQPMDQIDLAILAEVRALYDEIDPPPADLIDRVQFALALDEMFAEVAHMQRMPLDALAVRGEAVTGTRTETLTFSAERLTAMVTVSRLAKGQLRIDGWIAPPGRLEIRLRMQGERRSVTADESGRFVIDDLPEGFVQLSFHPTAGDDDGVIVTPLFQL